MANYIDNKRLYTEMIKYINSYNEAKNNDLPAPKVNNYIGECIWEMAYRLATKKNFAGYSYKEEMIGDAIENCLRYLHNFDPDKTKNPFAYFTQIMYYAFLRRIEKEQKQSYIRYKAMENSMIMNTLVEMAPDDEAHFQTVISDMNYDKLATLSDKFASKTESKKVKKKGVEKFIGDS